MKKFKKFMNGKGYYIALILCAVAIGISGYLYYRNTEKKPGAADVSVAVTDGTVAPDVSVVGTQPVIGGEEQTDPVPSAPVITKPLVTAAPVEGQVVMVYAMERLSYNPTTRDWRVHNGVDFAAEAGTQVCAAADGVVSAVYEDETMGTTVVISHEGGYTTCYASLDKEVAVQEGDQVLVGQAIGCVGNTALLENAIGEHLHFSVSLNDVPVDPAAFLGQE